MQGWKRTYLWNSVRSKSFTNCPEVLSLSRVLIAWFLNIRSSGAHELAGTPFGKVLRAIIPTSLHGKGPWYRRVHPVWILAKCRCQIQEWIRSCNLCFSNSGCRCGLLLFLALFLLCPLSFDLFQLPKELCCVILIIVFVVIPKRKLVFIAP